MMTTAFRSRETLSRNEHWLSFGIRRNELSHPHHIFAKAVEAVLQSTSGPQSIIHKGRSEQRYRSCTHARPDLYSSLFARCFADVLGQCLPWSMKPDDWRLPVDETAQ